MSAIASTILQGATSLIGAIGQGVSNKRNREESERQANQANAFNREQLQYQAERDYLADQRYDAETAYNKALQERIFNREDTAIQRKSADLKAAGLSKTLAAGAGASAGQAVHVGGITANNTTPRELARYTPNHGTGFSDSVNKMGEVLMNNLEAKNLATQVLQGQANIAYTNAQKNVAEAQASSINRDIAEKNYNWSYYRERQLPTGAGVDTWEKRGRALQNVLNEGFQLKDEDRKKLIEESKAIQKQKQLDTFKDADLKEKPNSTNLWNW